jgi:hypothetical protein
MTCHKVFPLFVIALSLAALSCAGNRHKPTATGEGPLFDVPRHWVIVNQKEGDRLYQADLRNNAGAGRLLVARLRYREEVAEVDDHVFRLHDELNQRIRRLVELEPTSREQLTWSNGIVGYRTEMRGELGDETVVLEGVTLSDGASAYIHYALFPADVSDVVRPATVEVLRSLYPLRGAKESASPLGDVERPDAEASAPADSDVSDLAGTISSGLEIAPGEE